MIAALKEGYGRYFDFSGRTDRKTFWLWVLGVFIIMFVLSMIDQLVWAPSVADRVSGIDAAGQPLGLLFGLITLIPIISMQVRRLHDTGRSGWWVLLNIIPLGSLVLIYFYIQPSGEPE